MTENTYFFDSYALIEITKGSKNYSKYVNSLLLTTKQNLFEVFCWALRQKDEEGAEIFLDKYYDYVTGYNKQVIKSAAKFKLKYKKRKLSMTDCIGYILSLNLGIKFLTGDQQFQDFLNVEYVK